MDFKFKCITWVENICTKFENMCEDVEGIVCQEAKYVENHVQTVGTHVKKFCSEVVHDFIPPHSEESDRNASPKEDPTKNNPSREESELIASAAKNSPDKSTSNGICTEDNKEDKTPACRLSKETSPMSSPISENYLDALSSGNPAKESGSNGSDPSLEESEDSETCQKSGEDSAERAADVSSYLPSPGRTNLILSGSSCENKVDDTELPPSDSILSSPKYDEIETSMIGRWNFHNFVVNSDGFSQSDSDDAELPKFNVGFEPVMDMNEFDDVKLGDSGMEVVPKELFSISSRPRKHGSYKKKIRDAFASRMGPRKQRDYEQLAILCGDLDSKANTVRAESSIPSMLTKHRMVSKNFQGPDLYESDWELV